MNKEVKVLSRENFQSIFDKAFEVSLELISKFDQVPSLIFTGNMETFESSIDPNNLGKPVFSRGGTFKINSSEDKQKLAHTLFKLVSLPENDFVLSMFEAWVLMNPDPNDIPKGSIEHHPKRTEAVIINILSKDFQTVVVSSLTRTKDKITLEKGSIDFDLKMNGTLVRKSPILN